MKGVGLWYVVIKRRAAPGFFWAHPNRLSEKKDAEALRDELKNKRPERFRATVRYFGRVDPLCAVKLSRRARLELFKLLGVLVLLGCAGPPSELVSHGGTALASAQSGAGSIGAAVSPELSMGAGADTPTGGASAAGDAQGPVRLGREGGGAVRVDPAATPCGLSRWRTTAATSAADTPPENALDGVLATRWGT